MSTSAKMVTLRMLPDCELNERHGRTHRTTQNLTPTDFPCFNFPYVHEGNKILCASMPSHILVLLRKCLQDPSF